MAFQFILPDIGEGVVEGEVVRWHVKPGDVVKEDQTLVEIMTDKATVQIPSPKAGKIAKLNYKEGEVAKVGKALLEIDTGAGGAAEAPAPAPAEVPAAPRAEKPEGTAMPVEAQAAPLPVVETLVASNGAREVLATPAVRKLARDEGVDINKVPGTGPYGRITREDVLRAASAGGQVISFTPPQPQQRPQEAPAMREARVENVPESRWDREQPRSNEPRREEQPQRRPEQPPQREQRPERQEQRPEQRPPQAPPPAPPPAPQAPQQPQVAALRSGAETRQPIRGLRKRIYDKMRQAKTTAAHFTYVEEFDLTELVKLREHINKKLEPQGTKLNYLPFIMKATVAALRKFPTLNAHVDDQRGELVLKGDYNLGIATQTDDGLMVPVVRNVDQKSMIQLSKELAAVSDRARKRQASQQDLSGGTFTITSLGQVGGMMATPVINYPEVAIMGVHQIKKKPWVVEDRIEIRDIANFSGSFDHRLIDGYIGALFLAEVKRLLEDPQTLFLEL